MPNTKPSHYLYFLDGLRAVAIVAVLLFHNDNSWLSGGFLGVEIFFVISGFIITKLLLEEWYRTGSINLKRFYLRRLRRLMPAVVTLILATWITVLCWFPSEINQIFDDLLYSLSFTNNWNYIVNKRSYFDLIGRPRLFEHLWSLGVEFQFYLIWALLCLVLFRLPRILASLIIAIFALVSTYWMAHLFDPIVDSSRIYFGTDTRMSALFIGSMTAFLVREYEEMLNITTYHLVNFIALMGSAGLVCFCIYAKSSDVFLFQWGFLAVSILTASVITSCLFISKQNQFSFILILLSSSIFRAVGIRAYGLYLWHWVVFSLTQSLVDVPFEGVILFLFRLLLTFVTSELTFQFIEKPIRNGCIERAFSTQKSIVAWLVTGSLSLVGCSSLVIATEQQLATTQQELASQEIVSNAMNTDINIDKNSVDITLIKRTENKMVCDLSPNNTVSTLSNSNPLVLITDQSDLAATTQKKQVTKFTHEPILTLKNRLEFEYNKNGKSYITRIKTVEKAGEKTPIFLLGDSVMMGAGEELIQHLPTASFDSQVGRQLSKGIQILIERKNNHTLSDTVIIHLGNNSPIKSHQLDELIALLSETRKIIFVNLKLPRNYESENNRLLSEIATKNANIRIVDWHKMSVKTTNIFGKDGIHLTGNGAKWYASLISEALTGK